MVWRQRWRGRSCRDHRPLGSSGGRREQEAGDVAGVLDVGPQPVSRASVDWQTQRHEGVQLHVPWRNERQLRDEGPSRSVCWQSLERRWGNQVMSVLMPPAADLSAAVPTELLLASPSCQRARWSRRFDGSLGSNVDLIRPESSSLSKAAPARPGSRPNVVAIAFVSCSSVKATSSVARTCSTAAHNSSSLSTTLILLHRVKADQVDETRAQRRLTNDFVNLAGF
ncbi:MAG: hypothetical protein FD127_2251 [Acidimicrobiaceae bacterium]|nr:MAG: hypothetical protein FD127_2251 [Acidimicrobiaceae bacterium]